MNEGPTSHRRVVVLDDNHVALAGAEFDQPQSRLHRFILIAATPRSGSNMLSRLLGQLGFGVPLEYFHPRYGRECAQRWGVPEGASFPAGLLEAVIRHRTIAGFCAVKCLPDQFAALSKGLSASWRKIQPCVIHIWRRDTLAQAISLRLAEQSGVWSFTPGPTTPPNESLDMFDLEALRRARKSLVLAELGWRAYLRKSGAPAVHVAYEDLVAHRARELGRLVEFLDPQRGLPSPLMLDEPLSPEGLRDRQHLTSDQRRKLYEAYEARFGPAALLPDP